MSRFVRALALAIIATPGSSCGPMPTTDEVACDFGQRRGSDGACADVDHLQVSVDERLDERDESARRGIGAFACTLRPLAQEPAASEGDCLLYRFHGELLAEGFMGDAGAVSVELDEPILMIPAPDSTCYQTDLFPSRGDLFNAGEVFVVSGSGGSDFPAFEAQLTAPETLAVNTPDEISRSADLELEWVAGDGDVFVTVVNAYDEETDESARVACFTDDDGSMTIPGALLAELLASDEDAALTFLRQRWVHLEPDDAEVAVELLATSSVIKTVPFVE